MLYTKRMKQCTGCKEERQLEEFGPNRHKKDGFDDMCRACRKAYNAEYYKRTKDRHNPGRAIRRKAMRFDAQQLVIDYLRQHPCVDCGETDIVVLEFDHQRDKLYNIADMMHGGYGLEKLQAEIDKCEVVCANDHRRRTAQTWGWAKLLRNSEPR